MVLAIFSVPLLLSALIWIALALMAFWIWSASKANAALYTLIGAGLLGVMSIMPILGIYSDMSWMMIIGSALVALGYYFTAKPVVDKHIQELKEKAKAKTASGGSNTPPPPA
jgi:phosphotransferase system  glucose/maltose/N-acetylglucosamine-specific IIC component